MSVGILKILELVTVQPPAISLTRFEAHFHDAGALIFQIMRRPNRLRRGIFPSGGPTPRLIRHGLVESDADFYFAGRHVPGAGNGGGLHHHWRLISMVGSISVCRKKPCSRGGHNCYCRQPEPEPEITVLSPGRFAQWSRRRSLGEAREAPREALREAGTHDARRAVIGVPSLAEEVDSLVENLDVTVIEALLELSSSRGIEPEVVAAWVKRDPVLRARVQEEASVTGQLKGGRRAQLPL